MWGGWLCAWCNYEDDVSIQESSRVVPGGEGGGGGNRERCLWVRGGGVAGYVLGVVTKVA